MLDLLQLFHTLLIGHPRGAHLLKLLRLQAVHLPAENLVGIFDNRLAQREQVERVVREYSRSSSGQVSIRNSDNAWCSEVSCSSTLTRRAIRN